MTAVDIDDFDSSDDEFTARTTLEQSLGILALDPGKPHFFGKSSTLMLYQAAMDMKVEYAGSQKGSETTFKRPDVWCSHPVSGSSLITGYC